MGRTISGGWFCGVAGLLVSFALSTVIAVGRDSAAPAPLSCPVTIANGSTPPGERSSPFHHGNGVLWTVLWPNGDVLITPDPLDPDGALGMKFPWWRGIEGQLTVEGRRLDSVAPPLTAVVPDGYGQTGFQASGLYFATDGCWEITGRVAGGSLTFVVRVVPIDRWGTPVATSASA